MHENVKASKYILYARKSSEGEDKQVASVSSQIDELKVLANRLGLKISKKITEEKSAKAPGREKFNEMLHLLQQGKADGIICWKLDRLSRNPRDNGDLQWLLQQGVIKHIQTYERSYYPSDNVLLMNVELGVANQFIKDLSMNTKRGLRKKLKDGWFPGLAPIGYLNNKYSLPDKAPIYVDHERFGLMRKLWDTLLEKRLSVREMTEVAFDIGLRTPKGKKLHMSKIHYLLTNPFYYGYFRYDGELHKGMHEPMITKSEFEQAQLILSGRYKSRPQYHRFAFTGLMRCGECGSSITAEKKMRTQKNGNYHEWVYYRCTRSINPKCTQKPMRQEGLEEQFAEVLSKITIPASFHQWAIKYLREEQEKEVADRESIKRSQQSELTRCHKRMDSLFELRLNKEIDADEFKKRKDLLAKEQSRLEELMADTNQRAKTWLERAEATLSFAETAKERFDNGDADMKKVILQNLGSNLSLRDKILRMELLPPFEIIESVALEVQELHSSIEPTQVPVKQEDWELLYSQSPKWGE